MKTCPICFSSHISETLQAKEMCKGTREVFEYLICGNCGSAYIRDFPSNIATYYEGYYSFSDTPPTIERSRLKQIAVEIYSRMIVRPGLSPLMREYFRCPLPWEIPFLSPNLQAFLFLGAKASARILDVGSGNGEFVRMMRRFGYKNAVGIDPFLGAGQVYANVIRTDIFSMTGTYDVILFNHSLEHMTDPDAALQKSISLLAPGGSIVVQVPNMNAREFSRYKENWCWLHAPFHYAIPSRRGLEVMGGRHGLQLLDAVCTSRPDHYLYSDEYARDIADGDAASVHRKFEDGSFDKAMYASLSKLANSLNANLTGDWIAYYLARS